MAPKDFKVIIAGGSIAGLTLANMLEKLEIDFVLLEAWNEIAPQVGASIGLLPNGLRIMDQLGMYDAMRNLIEKPLSFTSSFDSEGRLTTMTDKIDKFLGERYVFKLWEEMNVPTKTTAVGFMIRFLQIARW